MQPAHALCLFTTAVLLAGCNTAEVPAEGPAASEAAEPSWELANSTRLGLFLSAARGVKTPADCSHAFFLVPKGTAFLEASFTQPPAADPDGPGAGQLGLTLRAPNETRFDSPRAIGLTDPPHGPWEVQLHGDPLVVNQSAEVTIRMRGVGNATGTQELLFRESNDPREASPFFPCPA